MRITESRLRRIIREELLRENVGEVNIVGRHIFDEAQVLDGARVTDNAMVTDAQQN